MKWKVSRIICGVLSISMIVSAIVPVDVMAVETEAEWENELDVTDDPDETDRGEYVIYTEGDIPEEQIELVQEVSDGESVVCEADLSQEQVLLLNQSEEVYVEENFFLSGAGLDDMETGGQDDVSENMEEDMEWNYQMIHADKVSKEMNADENPVKVAVMDSGIELLSCIPVYGSVNLVKEEQDLPYYMNDMVGHGTAVADIINQIAPEAQLYSVRVLDEENRGRLSDVVEGIYWCIDNGMDIINMSFGTWKESEILRKAIQEASAQGIMIVASAGNGGVGANVEYPAAFPEVMAIGAVDTSAQRTEESVVGPEVEMTAPGEQILTKSVLGLETVNSGTSMAAPHVTGAAAFLMQQDRGKDAGQIRLILNASANLAGDMEEYGYGVLDLEYAQRLLEDDTDAMEKAEIQHCAEREPVPTFEEIDYVEGRWTEDSHNKIIQGGFNVMSFSTTERKLLKKGAVYPDETLPKKQDTPEWHGYSTENYIANYIHATRIAKAAGDTSSLTQTRGQDSGSYQRMKKAVTLEGIQKITYSKPDSSGNMTASTRRVSWEEIIGSFAGVAYFGVDDQTQKNYRKAFLYGMALHIATDAFSHSSYYKDETGVMQRRTHPEAHDTNADGNRYTSAKYIAKKVLDNYLSNKKGDVLDFSAYGQDCWKNFYMGNLLYYAQQANESYSTSELTKRFKAVDYKL